MLIVLQLTHMLANLGFKADTANDGLQAIMAVKQKPDLYALGLRA